MTKNESLITNDIQKRIDLVKQVGEEVVEERELLQLLREGKNLISYDGFEPSGQMHIAQGILRAVNVNKMIKAGFRFKMLVADWFAFLNNKMGGDLGKIQTTGKYFIELWRVCGMDLDNVEFVWTSDLIKSRDYWELVMRVAKNTTLKRTIRTSQIMGRKESEIMSTSQILYPCMQVADIFTLGARVTQLGIDQRKVNMLAREIGEELGFWKPVVVSHHMLMGLSKSSDERKGSAEKAIAMKMSKSDEDSAIFMTDSKDDVFRKINKAFCPEGEVKDNPILEYCQYILFEKFDSIKIERPDKFGGDCEFESYAELEKSYIEKRLHPQDLKLAVAEYIDKLLQPVREHFEKNKKAKALLREVRSFKITR